MVSRGITCPNPDARMRTQKAPISSLFNLILFFQKDASMSSTSAHRPFFKKCLYVFNIRSSSFFQKDACMSSTRHRPQRENLPLAAEEA